MNAQGTTSKFKATWTSITIRQGHAGDMIAEVNMDGHADGFGPFVGTMTVTPAGGASGTWHWASICWLDAGGSMDIAGQGRFETDRPQHFVGRGLIRDVLGQAMRVESTIDLATKTWEGCVTLCD